MNPNHTAPHRLVSEYTVYGYPSLHDLIAADSKVNEEILATGSTQMGTVKTYSQALALAECWRLTDRTRRTFILTHSPRIARFDFLPAFRAPRA